MNEGAGKRSDIAVISQIAALVFGFAAGLVGLLGVYLGAFPGPCGDNAGPGLGVITAVVVDVPVGLAALGIGWFVKKGSPWMRRACITSHRW